jgi:hypothetical protein
LTLTQVVAALLVGVLALDATAAARAQSRGYEEIFYPSAGLRIQAYLYRPEGDGPFPAVIYNHGSRLGRERQEVRFEHIGGLLTRAGYVALVAERRGYGRSDGPTWPQAVGRDRGQWIARLLLQVAENDRTTVSITAVGEILAKRAVPHRIVIYGSFGSPSSTFTDAAPGHQLFSARGVAVWERDVLDFLASHLGGRAQSDAFRNNTPSGGSVSTRECGWPCQGVGTAQAPPALPRLLPPYSPASLLRSSR